MNLLEASTDALASIPAVVQELELHRSRCEKEGRYDEALLAKRQIEQIRVHSERQRKEQMLEQQFAERASVDEAHEKELEEFNLEWDQRMTEFERHAASLREQLALRHKQEHMVFLQKTTCDTQPRNPKWSRDLLNLRRIEHTLARQKQYGEAAGIKAQADYLESKEFARWKEQRDAKIVVLEEQYLKKQELEMSGLIKRIASGREEQKQARKTEIDRLLQRYHNVKYALDSQHHLVRTRTDRYLWGGSSCFSQNSSQTLSNNQSFRASPLPNSARQSISLVFQTPSGAKRERLIKHARSAHGQI